MDDRENAEGQNQERRANTGAPLPARATSPTPDANQPHGKNDHNGSDSQRHEPPWFRCPDWHMVILTALLFVVGAVTLRVFYKQFAEMQAQTKILTRQAEQASKDSTEASNKIERQLKIAQDQAA
jgi:type VI protein secretion system component VasF